MTTAFFLDCSTIYRTKKNHTFFPIEQFPIFYGRQFKWNLEATNKISLGQQAALNKAGLYF